MKPLSRAALVVLALPVLLATQVWGATRPRPRPRRPRVEESWRTKSRYPASKPRPPRVSLPKAAAIAAGPFGRMRCLAFFSDFHALGRSPQATGKNRSTSTKTSCSDNSVAQRKAGDRCAIRTSRFRVTRYMGLCREIAPKPAPEAVKRGRGARVWLPTATSRGTAARELAAQRAGSEQSCPRSAP